MIINYKNKKIKIDHLECFIKPFKSEFELRKTYFEQIRNKQIKYERIYSSQLDYFFFLFKEDYYKLKYSIFYDFFIPVQSLIIINLLEQPEGKYVVETFIGNYIFYRDKEFIYSGIKDKSKFDLVNYKINEEELLDNAKKIISGDKNDYIRI